MISDGGSIARTAGLVITTSMATAAIQCTTWDGPLKFCMTAAAIFVGAFLAAMAADFGGAA